MRQKVDRTSISSSYDSTTRLPESAIVRAQDFLVERAGYAKKVLKSARSLAILDRQ